MTATVTPVTTPVFDTALKSIKFFNGRLLSGEDLTTEQAANRRADARLGRAVGDGVVQGLEVSAVLPAPSSAVPTVTVRAGLAFNRAGDAIRLGNTTVVGLYAPTAPAANATTVTPFAPCAPAAPGAYLTAAGVYLLTIAPAAGTTGQAPVLGLSDGTDKCNAKYIVEGVQFALLQLPVSASDLANTAQLRNLVAAQCFGFGSDPLVNPFGGSLPQGTPAPQGLIESLRPTTLTDAQVPLAVVGWSPGTGITFVDMWSARRRVGRADNTDDTTLPMGDRYTALGEAVLLQFQDHVQSLIAATPGTVVATSVFQYLPPLGLLPIYSSAFPAGFVLATFFQGLPVRQGCVVNAAGTMTQAPIAIEGARAQAMIRASFDYPLIDLSSGEMIWLFQTRQNMQASAPLVASPPAATPPAPVQSVLFFVTGQMPYFGESHFNAAYFDYAAWS